MEKPPLLVYTEFRQLAPEALCIFFPIILCLIMGSSDVW